MIPGSISWTEYERQDLPKYIEQYECKSCGIKFISQNDQEEHIKHVYMVDMWSGYKHFFLSAGNEPDIN